LQTRFFENLKNNKSAVLDELRAQLLSNDEKYAQLLARDELIQSTYDKALTNYQLPITI
jgi:hypothetical protein